MIAQLLTIDGADKATTAASVRALRETVIPELANDPGFVGGYWLRGVDGNLLVLLVWEDAKGMEAHEEKSWSRRWGSIVGLAVRSVERYEVLAHLEKAASPA
jgi:hypothetical protein